MWITKYLTGAALVLPVLMVGGWEAGSMSGWHEAISVHRGLRPLWLVIHNVWCTKEYSKGRIIELIATLRRYIYHLFQVLACIIEWMERTIQIYHSNICSAATICIYRNFIYMSNCVPYHLSDFIMLVLRYDTLNAWTWFFNWQDPFIFIPKIWEFVMFAYLRRQNVDVQGKKWLTVCQE